jgi:hypothetical protein
MRKRGVREFVRKVLLASEEPQERAPLVRRLVGNRPSHGITPLERVKHCALCDLTADVEFHLAAGIDALESLVVKKKPSVPIDR